MQSLTPFKLNKMVNKHLLLVQVYILNSTQYIDIHALLIAHACEFQFMRFFSFPLFSPKFFFSFLMQTFLSIHKNFFNEKFCLCTFNSKKKIVCLLYFKFVFSTILVFFILFILFPYSFFIEIKSFITISISLLDNMM